MMGQIDLAVFCLLLLTFFSGTIAHNDSEVQNSRLWQARHDLDEFMRTWSHIYCKISHEGRDNYRTRHHDEQLHGSRERDCIDGFEGNITHAFFNPVMECINATAQNTRQKDIPCFEERIEGKSLTPKLRKLGKDLIESFGVCCFNNEANSTFRQIRTLKTRQKPSETSRRCIRNKFRRLLESFNANDPFWHLDQLVKPN